MNDDARLELSRSKRNRERQAAKSATVRRREAVRSVHDWTLCLVTVTLDKAEVAKRRRNYYDLDTVAAVATDGSADSAAHLREQLLRKAGNIPDSVPISRVVAGEIHLPGGTRSVAWMFEMPNGDMDALARLEDVHRRFVDANPDAPVITCSTPVRNTDGVLYWYLNADDLPQALVEELDPTAPGELAVLIGKRLTNVSGDNDLPFDLLKPR